ncbi:MAG: isoprenylcysteine carboxylmethyltransferase family protein [Candidatus Nomurabacteria bacterium]|nr:isoprenylcysteine carboxylmethyltransferase family protein [Candidatus Nomurabacteria bacterium]
MTPEEKKEHLKNDPSIVHSILAHSYFIYFWPVILGLILDMVFPGLTFTGRNFQLIGIFVIFVSSMLIYWAQTTSKKNKNTVNPDGDREFAIGPYKYTRNPTYTGLMIMTLGLGLVMGSYFIFVFGAIVFIINKMILIPKEERVLEIKYGNTYSQYKKKVKSIL